MKKRKKQKLRTPPLSFLDKCVYGLAFLLVVAFSFGLALIFDRIEFYIASSVPATVAYYPHATYLFVLPALLYIIISLLVITIESWESRKPIFGNRKIVYGKEPWRKDCFPLFSPERKKRYVKPSDRKLFWGILLLWCIGLIIPGLLFPFGLFGRTCLLQNNSIEEYNVFNKIVVEYTADDFDTLTLKTNHVTPLRGAPYWEYVMVIKTEDGKKMSFSNGDFIMGSHEAVLEKITEIKGHFPTDKITLIGETNVEKVVDDLNLCDSEADLLYNLFR